EAHWNSALACKLNNIFDAGILAAFGDDDSIESATGFERFAHRVNAGEAVHEKKQSSVVSLQFTMKRCQRRRAGGQRG
ncbi:MAG TPA: hypothetical protein VED66_02660, partial [Candidatus Sulfotelmatobacter sp.]|nr:hypothetical protein [Candidatus Sulfotelmatobacter sp.]